MKPLRKAVMSILSEGKARINEAALPLQTGALPWRFRKSGEEVELLLVTSKGTNQRIIPKGWPMVGKKLWEAAAQEAFEEAGIRGRVEKTELGRFEHEKSIPIVGSFKCSIVVYPLQVGQVLTDWPEKGERGRDWFATDEAAEMVRSPELKRLIAGFNPKRKGTGKSKNRSGK